jgi:hypothetical protein
MRKQFVLTALAALACSAALAQAPAGATPPSEINPAGSGGAPAAKAQNKVENRATQSNKHPASQVSGDGKSAPVAEINPNASGGKPARRASMRVNTKLMDTNGDGVVSREEWDAYHANAWKNLNPSAAGVSTADIDKLNRTPKTRKPVTQ